MKTHIIVKANSNLSSIQAADEGDTRVEDAMSNLKDDFDYALDGFDKLVRNGNVAEALSIMNTLSDAMNSAIEESAALITQ